LLKVNPTERLGAGDRGSGLHFTDLKNHEFFTCQKRIDFESIEQGILNVPINEECIIKEKQKKW